MEHKADDIKKLQEEFISCQKLLTALGDSNRPVSYTHLTLPTN